MGHCPAHVPHFGNWDVNDEVQFTAMFDNARVGKKDGKKFNPNDPEENPAAFGLKPHYVSGSEDSENRQGAPSKPQPVLEAGLLARQGGDGHANPKMSSADPSKRAPTASTAKENLSAADGYRKASSAVGIKDIAGSEGSPNHQMYEGRLGNRPGSPYRNISDGGNAHFASTPGRSRLRGSARADETPDRNVTLPKFGAWDENDPSAGEGFTIIFNQHRNEKKQGGPGRVLSLKGDRPSKLNNGDGYNQVQGYQQRKSSFWKCCLGPSASD